MIVLRSLLFNIWFFGLTAALSSYGAIACHRSARHAYALSKLWAQLSLAGLRLICNVRLDLRGREHLSMDGPMLIASQHQSAYDTMIWLALLPRTSYVMKLELARVPLFGRLTVLAGMIPVDREGGAAALRGLAKAAERARDANRQIVVFPEGTRAAPGVATALHPGIAAIAMGTGLPVIPVRTDSGVAWARRSFRKQPGLIRMDILPPLPANLPRRALMSALQTAFHPVDKLVDDAPREL